MDAKQYIIQIILLEIFKQIKRWTEIVLEMYRHIFFCLILLKKKQSKIQLKLKITAQAFN